MSKWRQKGFVQDSDEEEEEESQLNSLNLQQHGRIHERVERVKKTVEDGADIGEVNSSIATTEEEKSSPQENETTCKPETRWATQHREQSLPSQKRSPQRPTASPFTPTSKSESYHRCSESPDPLQSSITTTPKRNKRLQLSSQLSSGILQINTACTESKSRSHAPELLQESDQKTSPLLPSILDTAQTSTVASNILGEFGIQPLSDTSDDDSLSDPPTDLESPDIPYFASQPHRRTAVQVVIPSSTALQKHLMDQESRREFRQRKPIQLHPYALEGELYRREVQSRGLKPVARPRSPERGTGNNDAETQEKEFDPNESPSSSPPELEIPVSTPPTRRVRKEGIRCDPEVSNALHSSRRRLQATQSHVAHIAKRRKLDIRSTWAENDQSRTLEGGGTRRDIWSIPPNSPPYSSSPPLSGERSVGHISRVAQGTPAPNLPTPSTSSILHDDRQPLSEPGSMIVSRSVPHSTSELRRPTRIVISDDSSTSSSEPEHSDNELRQVGRKIKGVLPASWLRFDRESQERRKIQQQERERSRLRNAISPETKEVPRGVAQRVTKRHVGTMRNSSSNSLLDDALVISDNSDIEMTDNGVYSHAQILQNSAAEAVTIATTLDRRYDQDDSDDMENDRLHLFTLGGTKLSSKKQTKLMDSFAGTKKLKGLEGGARKMQSHTTRKQKHASFPKRNQKTPPPALSIIDADTLRAVDGSNVPHFLRLARRQALQRPDLARQSPRSKHIRLHNIQDTKDANATLQQWRQGVLKPKENVAVSQRTLSGRSPLSDKPNNQQRASQHTRWNDPDQLPKAGINHSTQRRSETMASSLPAFRRTHDHTAKGSKRSTEHINLKRLLQRSAHRFSLPFRNAQLEGDEKAFGRGNRKLAFEKGLRHVDNQFTPTVPTQQLYMNPQLARFLANDDTPLPPLPSAKDIGESATHNSAKHKVRRRLGRKKALAKRLDIDTREYRQPNEPDVQEVFNDTLSNQIPELDMMDNVSVLQGLGPCGTRYPTTFDITSLQSDTYFHSSTFVGAEELRRALSTAQKGSRDLDELAGWCTISHGKKAVRCGPWDDATSSDLHTLITEITTAVNNGTPRLGEPSNEDEGALNHLARFLRSLINYVSDYLSFSDSIDRRSFVTKMHQLISTTIDNVSVTCLANDLSTSNVDNWHQGIKVSTYLLVLSVQASQIAQNDTVCSATRDTLLNLKRMAARTIVISILRKGIPEVSNFLDENKRHAMRQNGIQESDTIIESIVVCMHSMEQDHTSGHGFWDIASQELASGMAGATNLQIFESAWASLFSLLPFIDCDISGIPSRGRRESFSGDNWSCISAILKRLFELYANTYKKHGSSLNDYVRSNLARCHRLIKHWHWQQPEQMLNVTFDFFGKNGLRPLHREVSRGSLSLLHDLTVEQPLTLEPRETSFHIASKCLALGLRGMKAVYTEKKTRSFVFRTIPNHGRSYPKDQSLDEESLAALRNHHDLLCTLYWAAPPSCRPRLSLLRGLVNHETSHREACRVNVRTWANLAAFQIATDEPYSSLQPFAAWHKDMMDHTLRQYRLAKIEAEDYLRAANMDGTSDISAVLVRQAMEKNQEQVIATMRDCIAGVGKSMQHAKYQSSSYTFLSDCDVVHLLELPHFEDRRLISVIRDTLALLRNFLKLQPCASKHGESQNTSEESQDYGEFPELDDFDDEVAQDDSESIPQPSLEFLQLPLWHLLSNAFGAESMPDDNLLMDCVDTWVLLASHKVSARERSWAYYLDSFSQVSWQQLRHTEQTEKFSPYFLAALLDRSPTALDEHCHEIMTALLVSLADRESTLRFQHRLLNAILRTDYSYPLLVNVPFFRDDKSGDWDINAETLRSRRLALISSILCNMRDDVQHTTLEPSALAPENKRLYASMLKEFMARMKSNYQQLQQGSTVTGAYVEFVQKIVQFLKQYTNDIQPVLPFFTDSVAFPLPASDPTYIVGRLRGYALKASDLGNAKQLSVFIETIVQQAAADGQQTYLVDQLTSALCSEETPAVDRESLRAVLLQGILPAYIEEAFSSSMGFLIAQPILQSSQTILERMIFDLRVTEVASVLTAVDCVVAISHACIRGTEQLKGNNEKLKQPFVLYALKYMLEIVTSSFTLLEYVCTRTMTSTAFGRLPLVNYLHELSTYLKMVLRDEVPGYIPSYDGDSNAERTGTNASLATFCKKGLNNSIRTNWEENDGTIRFGRGNAQRIVSVDSGNAEERRAQLLATLDMFFETLREFDEYAHYNGGSIGQMSMADDIFV